LQVEALPLGADPYSVSRSLEAYLLWLFGFILFNNSRGNSVDRVLIPYAREIADSADDHVPRRSWGPAVLAATYRALCDACVATGDEPVLKGCPLLLQLWAYERLAVGRPLVREEPYPAEFYGDLDDDRPTMGTHWCRRSVRHPPFQLLFLILRLFCTMLMLLCCAALLGACWRGQAIVPAVRA
jgi:Plant mobile domain